MEVAGEVGDIIAVGSMLITVEVEGEVPDQDDGEEQPDDAGDRLRPRLPAPAPKDDEVEERIEVETSDPSDADDAMAADPQPAPKPETAPAPEPCQHIEGPRHPSRAQSALRNSGSIWRRSNLPRMAAFVTAISTSS